MIWVTAPYDVLLKFSLVIFISSSIFRLHAYTCIPLQMMSSTGMYFNYFRPPDFEHGHSPEYVFFFCDARAAQVIYFLNFLYCSFPFKFRDYRVLWCETHICCLHSPSEYYLILSSRLPFFWIDWHASRMAIIIAHLHVIWLLYYLHVYLAARYSWPVSRCFRRIIISCYDAEWCSLDSISLFFAI